MLSSVAGPLNKTMLLNVNEPKIKRGCCGMAEGLDDLGKGLTGNGSRLDCKVWKVTS